MSMQRYPSRFFQWLVGMACMGLLGCGTTMQPEHSLTPPGADGTLERSIYAFTLRNIDGFTVPLSRYQGNVLLVVNVASECRFTDQYLNLQRLYMNYRDQGFVVLGFPSNDFDGQEPGSDAEIKAFATQQFGIRFPLFSKISVDGRRMHPLYQYLTSRDIHGEFGGPITWNFTKFLIDRDGKTIARFSPEVDPLDPQVTEAIEAALR
jgi:glutathione peroxidase-family protein